MLYSKNKNYGVETVIPNIVGLRQPTSDKDYMYFQAIEDGASVVLKSPYSFNVSFEISQDGTSWNSWNKTVVGVYDVFEKITLSKRGDYFFIRATDLNIWNGDGLSYMYFQLGGKKISCGGNIMSLLYNNPDGQLSLSNKGYVFYSLFKDCISLTTAPELPATTLANYCYNNMFYGCTSLTTAPETLPATTLASFCYYQMFYGCTSLTTAPELPATNLTNAGSCYNSMFYGCISLTTAPELPATTLANYCYQNMFYNCTSLTAAPELPTTSLINASSCYRQMFYSCTSLTTAPTTLPATKLANYCYSQMFQGCTSLTTAPELPATTLANYCYQNMFYNCTSLTAAPELPATRLANYCYQYMFYNCTSLTTTPELPATTLASYCYQGMFYGCTRLTTAPELPATILTSSCYSFMFYGCTSLTTVPELPATTLANYCYQNMFYNCTSLTTGSNMQKARTLNNSCCSQMYYGCTNLTSACTPNVSSWTPSYFTNWLYNVASAGTLYKPSNLTDIPTSNANGVPTGWNTDVFSQTVTLSANESNTYGFSYSIDGVSYAIANGQTRQVTLTHPQGITITTTNSNDYIAVNGAFKQFGTTVEFAYDDLSNGYVISCKNISDANLLSFTAQEAGSTIGMQHNGTNTGTTKPVIYISTDNKNTFTLWDYSTITLSNVGDTVYMFGINPNGVGRSSSNYSRFTMSGKTSANGDCTTLIYPVGTTSIPSYGLYNLFYNCTNLTTAPELPATTLADYCYYSMFYNCTSLTTAPGLPATTVASYCYSQMFYGCTSLINAPSELPATTLLQHCYNSMFYRCTNLTTAPELPATTLAGYCYRYMFYGCTSLTTAPATLPATTFASYCYSQMFYNCTSLTTAPELPATTLANYCYNNMFYNCTSLNYVKVGATSWDANHTSNWVFNVSSTGDFYKPENTTIPSGVNGIPDNWTVHDI